MEFDRLPDDAVVIRGGTGSSAELAKSLCRHPNGITGISAVSAANKTFSDLCRALPHSIVRASTVGQIRSDGGDVVQALGGSPYYALIIGWEIKLSGCRDMVHASGISRQSGENVHRLFADFNNIDVNGCVRLNTHGTEDDLRKLCIELRDGLTVVLEDSEEFTTDAIVRFSETEGWVGVIDWAKATGQLGAKREIAGP